MIFRRVVLSAFLVGVCAGVFLSAVQMWQVIPTIADAEAFEVKEVEVHSHLGDQQGQPSQHQHNEDAWQPEDGLERTFYTIISNITAAVGFSLILISAMSFVQKNINLKAGLVWGLAGFAVFFVAPSLGLTTEIPGLAAADLAQRQYWWLLTVACTAGGLFCLAFLKGYRKITGLLLIAIPHLVGAPLPSVEGFSHPDPAVVALLEQLEEKFIHATAITNGAYWLMLGLMSAYTANKFVRPVRG